MLLYLHLKGGGMASHWRTFATNLPSWFLCLSRCQTVNTKFSKLMLLIYMFQQNQKDLVAHSLKFIHFFLAGGTNISSYLGRTRWRPCWRLGWSTQWKGTTGGRTSESEELLSATSSSPMCSAWGESQAGCAIGVLTWTASLPPVWSGRMRWDLLDWFSI